MTEAQPDPIAPRFRPDPELLALAHNHMLEDETASERFVRQRYEEACGALRVAMLALREIYPTECREQLSDGLISAMRSSAHHAEDAYAELSLVELEVFGLPMVKVMEGSLRTVEEFRQFIGRPDAFA